MTTVIRTQSTAGSSFTGVARETEERVAVVTFSNPPVNAMSIGAGLVDGLTQAIEEALVDPDIDGIVVTGAGSRFSAGADINDFKNDPTAVEPFRALANRIENASKPIVVAINGDALGGGLEFALAAHGRVAARSAKLGLPEVTLGLLPGGGGTQRLPRLIGAAAALKPMLSGTPMGAEEALLLGMVDAIADGDLRGEAVQHCRRLAAAGFGRTRDRAVDFGEWAEAKSEALAGKASKAQLRIVDCVDAAGDFESGIALETRLFTELMLSEESRGLRHLFFAQRVAARVPRAEIRPFRTSAVIGAGSMGMGISLSLLAAGLTVVLVDAKEEALVAAGQRIRQTLERDVSRGRLKKPVDAVLQQLSTSTDLGQAADVDIVIEAAFEDITVKKQIFERLDRIVRQGAILASNTSTLDLDEIAGFTRRPRDVVGLHFFNPANVMKLLEVVRGRATSPEVLASAMAFAKTLGKVGVVSGVCDGFIGNRMFEEYLRQAYFLLEEGCLPSQIDRALEQWGMAMGPLRTMDLAGQDIGWSIRKRRAVTDPDRPYSRIPDLICEMGRYGQKTGAGYYLYERGKPVNDPVIDQLVRDHAASLGVPQRHVSDAEIVERCIYALVNEGTKLLEEGIAARPSDLDVVYANGYGFPTTRGGPMFHADLVGLANVLARIEDFGRGYQGWTWEPARLLTDRVKRGASLESLNHG